jgi:hypothetical protein
MCSQSLLKVRNKCPQSGDVIVSTGLVCTKQLEVPSGFRRFVFWLFLQMSSLCIRHLNSKQGLNFTKTCFPENIKCHKACAAARVALHPTAPRRQKKHSAEVNLHNAPCTHHDARLKAWKTLARRACQPTCTRRCPTLTAYPNSTQLRALIPPMRCVRWKSGRAL